MTDRRPDATTLLGLLERYVSLTEAGIKACEAEDPAALHLALDAREQVAAQAEPLVFAVSADPAFGTAPWARSIERAAAASVTANARLLAEAQDLRLGLGRQVDLLHREAGASMAYATEGRRSGAYGAVR